MQLDVNRLTKQFGTKTAVHDFTLTLTNGVYGLLGANGAGKTTLMRLICGVQKPSSGTVCCNGKNIDLLGEQYRTLLGYLPQVFGYYSDFTAFDFLLYVAALKGLSKKEARSRGVILLDTVGLLEVKNKKIKTFSGGMKQRLGIAQAMLNEPKVLILDEPTAGLDPKERVRFRNLISAFSKDRIVLLSTHIVSDVEYIADEILVMKSGKLLHSGKPQAVTAEMNGCVWECVMPANLVDKYAVKHNVGNWKNADNGDTVLRIISEQKPMPDAKQVTPNLEDLYLFYFKEDTKND
ncbi:MAG: ABC transporter ATP-binding protein [Clostridiales bacterium]|jgi:ABC-2 type transport system ATP-binding protein|nr:ABC transporter ATP-binding protein [Clostridiales bacterium]